MVAKARRKEDPNTTPAQEKLWYFVMLRQMETEAETTRAAYQRLATAALDGTSRTAQTVILDWLEDELLLLHETGRAPGPAASQLVAAAVSLANALKQ